MVAGEVVMSFLLLLNNNNRSPHWPSVRNNWLKTYPACFCCMKKTKLNVHHIKPFHLYPDLELDENNLVTLCENESMNCHLVMGHLLDFKSWNPVVIEDCNSFRQKIKERLYS